MIIVKLTLHKGDTIYVLLNQISCFYPHSQFGSIVKISSGDELPVKQTIEEIRALIASN